MISAIACIASYHSGAFVVGSVAGSTITNGVTTIDIPATQAGDFILAFGSDQDPNPPVASAGWTNVVSYNSPNNARVTQVVSQITNGAAQTLTFTGFGNTTVPNTKYSGALIFRNATGIGSIYSTGTNSQGATFTVPAMALARAPSSVAVFSYYAGILSTTIAGATVTNGLILIDPITSFAGGTVTEAANSYLNFCSIEVY